MQTGISSHQSRHPHKTIVAIAFPAILANSSAPLVGLVDTWAIGHLDDPAYLAAIGLGSVIFNFIFWAFGFLRMGTTGLVGQARGAGNAAEVSALPGLLQPCRGPGGRGRGGAPARARASRR